MYKLRIHLNLSVRTSSLKFNLPGWKSKSMAAGKCFRLAHPDKYTDNQLSSLIRKQNLLITDQRDVCEIFTVNKIQRQNHYISVEHEYFGSQEGIAITDANPFSQCNNGFSWLIGKRPLRSNSFFISVPVNVVSKIWPKIDLRPPYPFRPRNPKSATGGVLVSVGTSNMRKHCKWSEIPSIHDLIFKTAKINCQ